jgi:hypothetical protein
VAVASAALTAIRDALVGQTDPAGIVARAAAFGIRVPGTALGVAPTVEQHGALTAAVESRVAAAAIGTPRDRLRALFGGDLPGVVSFTPGQPATLVTAVSPPASLLEKQELAPAAWLDATARTHPNAAALAEALLRQTIVHGASTPLAIAQVPWRDGDRWIATSFTSTSGEPPEGRLSVLIHAPAGFDPAAAMSGLLIDAWTETIPVAKRDTAMALCFNNASTRAPQTILLAVSPDPSKAWTTETVVEILQQTLGLARLRMQPSTTFSRGGLMPLAWLGQRPGGAISFSI